MPLNTRSQAGFSTGLIIAVILGLVLIVGIGFLVFKKSNESKSSSPSISENQNVESNEDKVATEKEIIEQTEDGQYLVIKEWGVKVLLPEALKGNAFYSLREFDDDIYGRVEVAEISSKLFQPECRETAGDLGLNIVRTTKQLDDTTPLAYKRNVLHSENYWYHSSFGKDGCSKFLEGTKMVAFNELKESIGTVKTY